ncbi:ATP-binding protein [candidate division KSB1 bacterium]
MSSFALPLKKMTRPVQQLVIVSGKGGTGKTTIAASFAALAENNVTADCDVDAADLHIIFKPKIKTQGTFKGGKRAVLDPQLCTGCYECVEYCRFDALSTGNSKENNAKVLIDQFACEGCGVCVHICPENAVSLKPEISGEWYVSSSRYGPLAHARLEVAAENSGKLVSVVRFQARNKALNAQKKLIIIDGSPGIGCPVIASLTNTSLVLIVTEPTKSALHDLKRIAGLARHFSIPAAVCINKYDINRQVTRSVERYCKKNQLRVVGKIPYSSIVTKAQMARAAIVEYSGAQVALEIKKMWQTIEYLLE